MKKLLPLIGVVYLGIEFQAFIFLMEIMTTPLSIAQLERYERYGYASAGLGISLLSVRFIWNSKHFEGSLKRWVSTILAAPLVYMLSVWIVYELIHQVPSLTPDTSKPQAFSAGVAHLANPSFRNSLGFYYGPELELEYEQIESFLSRYPTSDKQVQHIYLVGLRGLRDWDRVYKIAYDKMDKSLIDHLVHSAEYSVWDLKRDVAIPHGTAWRYWKQMYLVESKTPFLWGKFALRNVYLIRQGQEWPLKWLNNESFLDQPAHPEREEYKLAAWAVMRKASNSLPERPADLTDLTESVRIAHTESLFSKAGIELDLLIPWHQDNVSHDQTESFKKTAMYLTPFLFSQEGEPLLNIDRLHDRDIMLTYTETLRRSLPEKIREIWDQYHENLIIDLAYFPERWKNPVELELNKDVVRIGLVLPWLLGLSFVLLLLNGLSLVKSYGVKSIAPILTVLVVTLIIHKSKIDWIWLITSISIKETQIFLY